MKDPGTEVPGQENVSRFRVLSSHPHAVPEPFTGGWKWGRRDGGREEVPTVRWNRIQGGRWALFRLTLRYRMTVMRSAGQG